MKNPEIRFINDNIDWEERKLGELNNLSVPTIYKNYYLEIGDIKPLSNSYILDKTKKIVSGAKLATNGSILVSTVRPTRGAICKLKDGNMFVSSALYQFNSNNEFLNDIILQQLQTYKFLKYCGDNCEGGTYPTISKENIDKFIVKIPKNVEKISKTLTSIDVKITNQTTIIEKLYNTKSALLIKMFPQENQSVPELRFDGFTNAWEQRKFGDIFKEYSEKHHEELPPLMIIQGGGTIRRDESDRNISFDTANLYNYKVIHIDDFIVHLRSFEGGLEKSNHNGIISPAYHTFHGDNISSDFYYPYFRSKKFINIDLTPHVYGVRDGRSIDMNGLKTILIPYTSYTEQEKIGRLLLSIDKTITLHQRKPFHLNFSL